MSLKKIIGEKHKKAIFLTINIVLLFINVILLFLLFAKILPFTKTIGNIFYAIDTENIILIKTIVILNPQTIIEKNKGTGLSRAFVYSIPLMYATNRSYPQKDIIMFLLEKTHKYYNDNYDEIDKTNELNIVLYNIFQICLIDAYKLNPYSFKDYPDYDIPDKILELGFPINYFFNIDNYWNIKEWVLKSSFLSEFDRIRIKEYLISKKLSFDE
jgi:hypothetical protein